MWKKFSLTAFVPGVWGHYKTMSEYVAIGNRRDVRQIHMSLYERLHDYSLAYGRGEFTPDSKMKTEILNEDPGVRWEGLQEQGTNRVNPELATWTYTTAYTIAHTTADHLYAGFCAPLLATTARSPD
jgi:hypothetical protein